MAKADVKMPDEFLSRISRLGAQTDSIAEKVLQAGGEVALAKVKSNLKSVVGSGTKSKSRSTGELERSLGLSPVMVDKNGNHDIKVGFSEPRSDGSSNAKIANILEYGTSSHSAITRISNPSNSTGLERRPARMRLPCLQRNGLRRPGPLGSFQKRGAMVEHLHKRISHLNLPRGSRLNSSCIPQSERLLRLNASAKQMMQSLTNDHRIEAFKEYGTLPHESE